jgi:hypothetical protein
MMVGAAGINISPPGYSCVYIRSDPGGKPDFLYLLC